MEIKDRIAKIKDYFKEMQITTLSGKQVIYVVVNFPNGWIIDENLSEKFDVLVKQGEDGIYFVTEIENGENTVFDAIEYSIKSMKDAMERAKLLNDKVKELKAIFEDEDVTLEELKTLTITYTKLPPEVPAHEEITPLQTKKRGKKKETKKDE